MFSSKTDPPASIDPPPPDQFPIVSEPLSKMTSDEMAHKNRELESSPPEVILAWAVAHFGKRLTFATAFGPEGMVILYLLSKIDRQVDCFNLDTGYQFDETLQLRDQVLTKFGIEVTLRRPELSVEEYERQNGGPVYRSDPNRCCHDRKIRVIHEAIQGKSAWISAIRRDQSPDREHAPIVGWDSKFHLVKINPLANLTKTDIWTTILENKIPYNPLHDQGFPSIGCQPCTRPIQIGEDERSGRWSGSQKTECGLHSTE
jgi:phosphoadenosine phosphosulfate reductase